MRAGATGHLVLAVRAGAALDHAQVVSYLSSRLAKYKMPSRLSVVETLPRTSSATIQRQALRKTLDQAGWK